MFENASVRSAVKITKLILYIKILLLYDYNIMQNINITHNNLGNHVAEQLGILIHILLPYPVLFLDNIICEMIAANNSCRGTF